ncbi:hypothetical protein [Rhodococcus sp. HNM0569]|uniref:hypothetical protein n=1 Tax=Rhodococcus sp. HNM0569 TaxID=2716340 RepID=UPI00146E5F05|nr:hypothetical protein [Rhodococcus sp. HNM0569]NLU81631.1 hypothetical protein [Rhodococcus sp. HNM0569]
MALEGEWKKFGELCAADAFSIDREGLVGMINLCDEQVTKMTRLAHRARRELWVESLGIGESDIQTAQAIVRKFQDKAIGGGNIPKGSSAVEYLESHAAWARNFGDALREALKKYEEQDAANAAAFGGQL